MSEQIDIDMGDGLSATIIKKGHGPQIIVQLDYNGYRVSYSLDAATLQNEIDRIEELRAGQIELDGSHAFHPFLDRTPAVQIENEAWDRINESVESDP